MTSLRVTLCVLSVSVLSAGVHAQFVTRASMSDTLPPVLGFIDISTTGFPVVGVGDDTEHLLQFGANSVKNPFFASNGSVVVSSNGVVVMGLTSAFVSFNNMSIGPGLVGAPFGLPSGAEHSLCVYWDDLFPTTFAADTTIWFQINFGVLIIQWERITHENLQFDAHVITFQVQIFDTDFFPDCTRQMQFLYQDTIFNTTATQLNDGASATVGLVSQLGNVPVSFNNPTITPARVFSFRSNNPGTLVASSPFGPTSVRLDFTPNCVTDFRFLAVTFNQGAFPNGWLFGIDIPFNELAHELAIGPPYTGAGGAFTIGPFGGLPSGLTFYAVLIGLDGGVLLGASNAISYTIP